MNAGKTCLFCGKVLPPKRVKQGGTTDEHIIPQWLIDHLGIKRTPLTALRWDVPSQSIIKSHRQSTGSFVSGRVCAKCNSGWMSHLEGETKPILIRLIDDPRELPKLSQQELHTIARWTFKTAAVVNQASFANPANPLDRPVPSAHTRVLMKHALPDEVAVFAGACPSNTVSQFIHNASWAVPKHSVPLQAQERHRSYKVGMSFRSLCLGAAYYPNADYCYGLPRRTHFLLYCRGREMFRPDADMSEYLIVANAPILEGFLANVFVVSKARKDMIENDLTTEFITPPGHLRR